MGTDTPCIHICPGPSFNEEKRKEVGDGSRRTYLTASPGLQVLIRKAASRRGEREAEWILEELQVTTDDRENGKGKDDEDCRRLFAGDLETVSIR